MVCGITHPAARPQRDSLTQCNPIDIEQ